MTKLDARGWNTAAGYGNLERMAPRPQKPQPSDRQEITLEILFYGVSAGLLAAGVLFAAVAFG